VSSPLRLAGMLTTDPTVVDAFAEQVQATGATLHRCATVADARRAVAEILSSLAETAPPPPTVAATESATRLLPDDLAQTGADQHAHYLDLGVSTAVLGVAETGSMLLAPSSRWDRLLGILARTHVVAVAERDVRASLDDLPAALHHDAAPYLSLVTGPSRTADIERVITIGAHGPRALHVLLVTEWAHA